MTPVLWPDLAHLPDLLSVLVAALLAVGLGALAGARRAETALIAGWGVAALATVVVGTLTALPLAPVMEALGALGLGGLGWICVAAARGAPVLRCAVAGRVLLLGLPLLAGIEGMVAAGWDDFSHWLPNLAYLCLTGHFPTLAMPAASDHAAYPYALALPGYAVFLLRGQIGESAALAWNALGMLAGGACIAAVLDSRLPPTRAAGWATAAIGVLLGGLACPSFVPKIAFSNMADSASGSVLIVLLALVFDWWCAPDRGARGRIALTAGLCCVALVDLRQSNFALFLLLLIGVVPTAAWHRPRPEGGWRALVLALPAPLLAWALWDHYAKTEIPGGAFVILPVAEWHWATFGTALVSMLRVMLAKIGLFGLILAIGVRGVWALRRTDTLAPAERVALWVGVVLCLGNIGFLAFTYLAASFGAEEAAAAASFWRYAGQTGPLAVLALVASLPRAWLAMLLRRQVAAGLVAVAVLLPVGTIKLYRHDLASPTPTLRRIALDMAPLLPPGTPLRMVDLTGPGFAPVVVAYQLWLTEQGRPARPVSILSSGRGYSLAEARAMSFAGAPYLWLAEGAPEMQALFGPALRAGCAYLLRAEAGGFAIAGAWPVGPFSHPVNANGWSLRRGGSCS